MVVLVLMCAATIVATQSDAEASDVAVTGLDYDDGKIVLHLNKTGVYSARINDHNGKAMAMIDKISVRDLSSVTELNPEYSGDMESGSQYSFILKDRYGTTLNSFTFTIRTVTFDGNGGTGSMESKEVSGNYVLPECKFVAPEGKVFKSWSVNGQEKQPGDSIAVTGDTVIKAVWTDAVRYAKVTWKNDDGSILREDTVEYDQVPSYGENPTKAADKQYTYTFREWTPEIKAVDGDAIYTAVYDKTVNEYTVSVKVNDSSMGSYTLTVDGVAISSGDSVEYGKTVMLSIVQNEGYKLTLLKDNEVKIDPLVLSYPFDVKEVHEIEIGFTATSEIPYIVTISCGEGGSISPTPKDGKHTLYGGQSMDFVITADFGWKIKSVKLDEADQKFDKISATVTISKIDAEHAISVEFEKAETYEVVVGDSSHGDVSVTGLDANGKAVEGRTVTVTVTPDFGYYAYKYFVNGVDVGIAAGTGSFTIDVDGNLKDGKIAVQVVFMLSSSGDDDDDPVPQPPTPSVPDTGDDDDDDSVMLVAVAAACVIVAIIALYMLAERRN